MALQITPSKLSGSLHLPSSKSHTLRAILFAALSEGACRIDQFLPSPDTFSMIEAVKALGASVRVEPPSLFIEGFGAKPKSAKTQIDCGNSGLVLRLVGAVAALSSSKTIFTGDASICSNRPVSPLLKGLTQLGANAYSVKNNDLAPIAIQGPLAKQSAAIDGADSQPVSGLLIAAALAPHPIEIRVTNPGEKPWVDLTLNWLDKLNLPYEREGYTRYNLQGNGKIAPFIYTVPGDFSTAAFPIAAALLTKSKLVLHNVDMQDCQGDKAFIVLLEKMGAVFSMEGKTLTVQPSPQLKGLSVDLNNMIDALPILAVVGCFAKGKTEIFNASMARKKESDRIACIVQELKKMGANIEEKPDGLVVYPSVLKGATLFSHHDHRIALSLSIAALAANSSSRVLKTDCIAKTYPDFVSTFQSIGAQIDGL